MLFPNAKKTNKPIKISKKDSAVDDAFALLLHLVLLFIIKTIYESMYLCIKFASNSR